MNIKSNSIIDLEDPETYCQEHGHNWVNDGEKEGVQIERCSTCDQTRPLKECLLSPNGKHEYGNPVVLRPPESNRYYVENGAEIETIRICKYCEKEINA
jgi:hypothetical protein